jgi:hypothetical protein
VSWARIGELLCRRQEEALLAPLVRRRDGRGPQWKKKMRSERGEGRRGGGGEGAIPRSSSPEKLLATW